MNLSFTAVRLDLPSGAVNLLTASGLVRFSVDGVVTDFKAAHPIFGHIATMSDISSNASDESPHLEITMLPPTIEAAGYLAQTSLQGSRVRVWRGEVNPQTGLVVGDPERLWNGDLDTSNLAITKGHRSLTIDSSGIFERFLIPSEGDALSEGWHLHMFGGSKSILAANISTGVPTAWGKDAVAPSAGATPVGGTTGSGGAGNGGSYGGGGGGGGNAYDIAMFRSFHI